jgi:hypothetical protein
MPKVARERSKLFTKLVIGKSETRFDDKDWRQLEKTFGLSLSDEVKLQIESAQNLYCSIGRAHSGGRRISVALAERSLSDWLKASGRLRNALGRRTSVGKLARAEVCAMFVSDETNLKRLGKMQPLVFVNYVLSAAMGAAQAELENLEKSKLSPDLDRDMWGAWVKLIELAVSEAGIKVSASSSNKVIHESPFVKVVMYLQGRLPNRCKKYSGYESVAKNVQWARKEFKGFDRTHLRAIIAGWGTGILKAYAKDRVKSVLDELMSSERGAKPEK